ncbi:hypothetical protein [Dactylosporangium sp. NPDC005555]|uniref:hypothetical protein n=1 Tax=Dactylosporangium sp. NPDC005555 TaxID=3154889 RepID=UPI0033A25B25
MAVQETDRRAARALGLCVVAAVTYFLLAAYGPGWWRGARLDDVDAPLDLGWLHDGFAWLAQYVGAVLAWLFGSAAGLLVVVVAARFEPAWLARAVAVARTVPMVALLAVPGLAVAWFLASQVALLIAPFLGMYHGEYHPAVP